MDTIEAKTLRPMRSQLVRGFTEALRIAEDNNGALETGDVLGDALVLDALRERATDLHLDPQEHGVLVRLRIDGRLHDAAMLSPAVGVRLIRHFKAASGMELQHFVPANTRMTRVLNGRTIDLRLASLPCAGGEKLAIRLLDRAQVEQRIDQLGLRPEHRQRIEAWVAGASGMFLVTGPTGSGKTTSLYAVLQELRRHESCVATIEDPIEYRIDGVTQTQMDRRHGLGFGEAVRAMLRLDADHLLLGEIRDEDAARAAAEAAGTGRVLMSTLHCPDAIGAVATLRHFGLADYEIASLLRVVISQRLVRRLCPECRRPERPSAADHPPQTWIGPGCEHCRGLGYRGRVGLFEVWLLDDDDRALIRAHADEVALRRQVLSRGFRTLLHDGYLKASEGVTSFEEAGAISATYPHSARRPSRRASRRANTRDPIGLAVPLGANND